MVLSQMTNLEPMHIRASAGADRRIYTYLHIYIYMTNEKEQHPKRERQRKLKTGSRICHYQCGIPKCHCLIAYCRFSFPNADSHMTGIKKIANKCTSKKSSQLRRRRSACDSPSPALPGLSCTVSCPLSGLAGMEPAVKCTIMYNTITDSHLFDIYIYIWQSDIPVLGTAAERGGGGNGRKRN